MANNKSAKKRVLQNEKRRMNNCSRRSSIKTAVKKVMAAIETTSTTANVEVLFNDAQAKIARAKGKGLLHRNTAARKISRLAKRVNAANALAAAAK
ncbi:30S ribosomal protein S20 [Candidatus Chromulinivorax destructor]|uniref:Small ribosomal subunit protein bS20 n=1 Tax=Candidatus Chromulinivorax destructor TaxID=2066483 RepID=A0A345ZCP6_9BACT|nr:30S ribosomal protein S20 [Candidatus Chromulinivorax destructor]AXK61063.1 30S ribosomal protein S20 [Candidatus Chromulinivorax destructor]